MASCSTTPFDGLGKRVNADHSHHRDTFVRQNSAQGLRHQNNPAANAQFAQFVGGAQASSEFAAVPAPYDFATPQLSGATEPRVNGWANQFSAEKSRFAAPEQFNAMFAQSHHDPVQQQPVNTGYYIPLDQLKPITPMLQPLRAPPAVHTMSTMQSHQQIQANAAIAVADNSAFDQAFAAAEAQIKNLELNEQQQQTQPPPTAQDQANLRDAAASVLETVASANADDPTVSKMKNSKFMALMESLKNENVKLGRDHESFVTKEGEDVSVENLEEDLPANLRPRQGESGQQYVDRVYQQLHNQEGFGVQRAPRGQAPLEDPFDYLNRMKTANPMMNVNQPDEGTYSIPQDSQEPQNQQEDDKPPMLTPFEAANLYGPGGMSMADWEEHYDDAVWVPS